MFHKLSELPRRCVRPKEFWASIMASRTNHGVTDSLSEIVNDVSCASDISRNNFQYAGHLPCICFFWHDYRKCCLLYSNTRYFGMSLNPLLTFPDIVSGFCSHSTYCHDNHPYRNLHSSSLQTHRRHPRKYVPGDFQRAVGSTCRVQGV